MQSWLAGLSVFAALSGPAGAQTLPQTLTPDTAVRVASVIDSDTLALEDGRELRLIGLMTVKAMSEETDPQRRAIALATRERLAALAAGRALVLAFDTRRGDRYGRVLAHARNEDGVWLQGALLEAGLARVATYADARLGAAEMLALEETARRARRGLWAVASLRVRRADELGPRDIDSFQIVSGRVSDVAIVKGRTYLNFGADWRSDFTIAIAAGVAKQARAAGLDPAGLAGKSLRVRGWIKSQNGPLIELTHPEQIEVLP